MTSAFSPQQLEFLRKVAGVTLQDPALPIEAAAPALTGGQLLARGLGLVPRLITPGLAVGSGAELLGELHNPFDAVRGLGTKDRLVAPYPGMEAFQRAGYEPMSTSQAIASMLGPDALTASPWAKEGDPRLAKAFLNPHGQDAVLLSLLAGQGPGADAEAKTPEPQGPAGFPPISMGKPSPGYNFSGMEQALADAEAGRQASLETLRGLKPTLDERPQGEKFNRLIQGLAGGAAQAGGDPRNVGRILAAAGAGGLGELGALDQETRQEKSQFDKETRAYQGQLAEAEASFAQQKAHEVIALEHAKMQDWNNRAQLAVEDYKARLGSRHIYYDPSTGTAVLSDTATGQIQTEQVSDVPLQLAKMKMVKAMGGGLFDLATVGGKGKLDPVQDPAIFFAHLVANGYGGEGNSVEEINKEIFTKMEAEDPDGYNALKVGLMSNDKNSIAKMQQLRTTWAANLAMQLIANGKEQVVFDTINNVHKSNMEAAQQRLRMMGLDADPIQSNPSRTR